MGCRIEVHRRHATTEYLYFHGRRAEERGRETFRSRTFPTDVTSALLILRNADGSETVLEEHRR